MKKTGLKYFDLAFGLCPRKSQDIGKSVHQASPHWKVFPKIELSAQGK